MYMAAHRRLCYVDFAILCVYGWCITLVTCRAQLTFHLLHVNFTTACINSHMTIVMNGTYCMLSAGYLSIQITKHLLVFSSKGGVYCNETSCPNSYSTSMISWQQSWSNLNSYYIVYGINKFPFGLTWYGQNHQP